MARLYHDHDPEQDYHQWVPLGLNNVMIKCNRIGVPNPRMWEANWIAMMCNNLQCNAQMVINQEASAKHFAQLMTGAALHE